MPDKAPRPCSYPGCPNVILGRYCEAHKALAAREYDKTHRHPDRNKTYGHRWRLIRDRYIARHPLCESCLKAGRYVPAAEVHHIVPPERGGTHADDNLTALCQSCHTKTRSS